MNNTTANDTLQVIAVILIVFLMALMLVVVGLILTPKGRATCRSFGSYADIVSSYNGGNSALDGNGDGVPCQSRRP